jgi:hypothetical protein
MEPFGMMSTVAFAGNLGIGSMHVLPGTLPLKVMCHAAFVAMVGIQQLIVQ